MLADGAEHRTLVSVLVQREVLWNSFADSCGALSCALDLDGTTLGLLAAKARGSHFDIQHCALPSTLQHTHALRLRQEG